MSEFSLTKIEEKILKFWEDNNILEKSLAFRQAQGKPAKKFVFYEGPPTANGLPHIGHFLTRAFKDLFIRYKTMTGFFVPRRAGWDTHGLPVEIEVEKELGLKSKKEIEKYGIAKFNKKAKESAQKYKTEWEKFSKRIGFWLDFKNPYITYANDYIEALWNIVKYFDKRKFLYQGHKVLPWCPRCGTALSSHEVAQGYQTITDTSVIVKFLIKPNSYFNAIASKLESLKSKIYTLAWTTTPWTLPGNVALAIGEKIDYAVISKNNEQYILAKDLVEKVIEKPYEIVKEIKGKDLVGLEYEPLFDIPVLKSEKSYKIYPADFVSTEEGTDVVHTAVMYGEDDYQLGEKIGLPKYHTVDQEGKFKTDISIFRNIGIAGQSVKDAEKGIIDYLKRKNLLFKVEPYTHEYPFCWRCKTRLLYYAADSWFVKVTAVKKELIANNKKINWVPPYIKEGRFGQWLKEVKDWAFSRDRFWGTPLPIWACAQIGNHQSSIVNRQKGCGKYLVIGSLEELEKYRFQKYNTYFILRHGESEKNNFKGREINSVKLESDKYDLTEKGFEQAKATAKKLKTKKIDLIFASPFLRTKRTAEIIADELNLEVKTDYRLKEVDHGSICEGKENFVCISKDKYPYMDFNTKFGLDGESRNDVRKRLTDFLKEIESKYKNKNILIVSHADPMWFLEGVSKNLSEEKLFEAKKNQILKIKDGAFSLLKPGEMRILNFGNFPRDEFGNLDLHRPYADEIILKCPECRGKMLRVPEVIDVWFDSGSMPFAQNQKIDFPADFITEGVDQTRGWFYTLLAVSTLLGKAAPYKNVISLGHVLDKDGKKMSKSLGNVITPDYAIGKFGVDAVRWWFYRVNQAGESKSFREEELKEINNGFVRVILNSLRFWQLYQRQETSDKEQVNFHKLNFHKLGDKNSLSLLDKWFLSRWNSLVKSVTESMNKYNATTASREIEKFVIEDLSNWWIRRSRASFQLSAFSYQQELLRFILLELAKLIAPFAPFLAEHLYQEVSIHPVRSSRASGPEGTRDSVASVTSNGVHFHDWPKVDKKLIDKKLEEEMESVRKIVSFGLAKRKSAGIRVRQPLALLKVSGLKFKVSEELLDLIKEEVNVKSVEFQKGNEELSVSLDIEISPALRAEGWVREFVRMIQDARRDAGYNFDQKITVHWFSEDNSLSEAIKREEKLISQKTVLKELKQHRHDSEFAYDVEKEQELEPGRKIWLGLKK